MPLTPPVPPGRTNRKARAFTAEIQRLRSAGYSVEAVRLALLEAGLAVSPSTIKRETARSVALAPAAPHRPAPPPLSAGPSAARQGVSSHLPRCQAAAAPASFLGDTRSGREIADAFLHGRITNPLLIEETPHEDRRD